MRKTLSIFLSLMLAFALILGVIPASFSATQKIEPGGQYNLSDYQKIANKSIGKFNESPQLLELVKQKKLPSVEDRLPKNPAVVQPFDKLGRYGGTWRVYSPIAWYGSHHIISYEPLVRIASNLTDIEPNIAERWQISSDGKSLTF
ncbi:MAG TPA: ABC transporter substrate-binding protein, partial [bacterium]|nr:ABC transporter substrate-binding protein [bacterium]